MIFWAFSLLLFGILTAALFVHEGGHFLAAKVYGYRPSFSRKRFAVAVGQLSKGRRIIILAGVAVQSVFILGATLPLLPVAVSLTITLALVPLGYADFRELIRGAEK